MNDDNKEKLDRTVRSKIKGLGLDALFHQVDVSKKDEDTSTLKGAMSKEEKDLIEKLKNNTYNPEPKTKTRFSSRSFLKRHFSKRQNKIGIVLGPSALKVLIARTVKERTIITKTLLIPIPHIITNSEEKLVNFIQQSLLENISPNIFKESLIYTLIPRNKAIIKMVQLPTHNLSEVDHMLEFEVEHHIPFSLNEAEIDHHILKQENNSLRLLLVAVKKDEIQKHLDLLGGVGIQPDSIGISSLSLYNSMTETTPQEGITLELSIGSESSDINIVSGGELFYSRGLECGSKGLTLGLAERLSVSFENAEKIKKENGILLSEKSVHETEKGISEEARTWAEDLINEIKKTIQYFQLKEGIVAIDRIVLTGGGSRLKNLNEYIKESLKIKTITQKPLKSLQIAGSTEVFNKYFHEFNCLLGLIVPAKAEKHIDVNVLSKEIKHSLHKRTLRAKKIFLSGSILIAISLLLFIPALLMGLRAHDVEKINNEIIQLKPKVQAVNDLKEKIQTIENYISEKKSVMEVIREISMTVTQDITINNLSFRKNKSVILEGEASSHASAVNLSRSLSEPKLFKEVNLQHTRKIDRIKPEVNFEILCILGE